MNALRELYFPLSWLCIFYCCTSLLDGYGAECFVKVAMGAFFLYLLAGDSVLNWKMHQHAR